MKFKKMKKGELIKILIPATIECWKNETPQYKHDGKEKELNKILQSSTKEMLIMRAESLQKRGYL